MRLSTLALPLVAASPLSQVKRWWNDIPNSLGQLAVDSGKLYFGTAWQSFYLANQNFSNILIEQFNGYTPENEMKWEVIEPEQGVFNWTGGDIVKKINKIE
jgi:endo-1,4-beta-xylanase